jgi:hypothetical protein
MTTRYTTFTPALTYADGYKAGLALANKRRSYARKQDVKASMRLHASAGAVLGLASSLTLLTALCAMFVGSL